eukprot:scaffold1111_cov32-Phaeocystis_antarctica.AAC.1
MAAFETKSHIHEETKGRAGHTAWSLLSSRATFLSLVSMARPGRDKIVRQVGSRSRLALGLLERAFAVLWLPTQA